MLKRIVIAVAILLVVALGAGGVEAYRFYSEVNGLVGNPLPRVQACPSLKPYQPQLLPWTHPHSSQTAAMVTPTPTAALPIVARLKPCNPTGDLPSLSGKQRINILVLGSDNDAKFDSCGLLSQTVMVVTIDPLHKRIGFFSIPRDSWLAIPGSVPGDLATYHKMDEAMSYGEQAVATTGCTNPQAAFANGVQYAEDTVYENFGIRINYYTWVGLQGFQRVVNTLHGVVVNSMHPMLDDSYPADNLGRNAYALQRVYIPAGPQYMDGSAALQYVRTRHSDLNGDYGRGARQEQTLIALRRKIDTLGLTDIFTIKSLVDDLQNSVRSDIGKGSDGMSRVLAMANFARGLKPSSISKAVLTPPKYSYEGMSPDGSQDVVYLNWPQVQTVVQRMFGPVTGVHRPLRHQRPPLTATDALRLLVRTSGAVAVTHTTSHGIQKVSHPISGKIYFVAKGNVWYLGASGVRQVTHTTAIDAASITPNGHKLTYYRRWSQNNADVWVRNMVTGQSKQITQSRATDGVVGDNLWFVNPMISPDGKTVVYESDAYKNGSSTLFNNPDCQTSPSTGSIDLALYAYDVGTSTPTQLTAPCYGAGGDADPRFDPANPNRLAYTQFYYLPNSNIASRLIALDLSTGARTVLTPFYGRAMQAAWQPNGRHLAWVGSSDQSTTLYEAPFYGGRLHTDRLQTVDSGLLAQPEFSPDGRHLVYFKLVGNDFQLWEVDLKNGWPTGQPMQLLIQSGMTASAPLTWIR
jgi:LCP family protein required for cell wall assembly